MSGDLESPLVVTARDLQQALRVCRTTATRMMVQAGASRVVGAKGRGTWRLPVPKLVAALGPEAADIVVRWVRANVDEARR